MRLHVDGYTGMKNCAARLRKARQRHLRYFARQEDGSILIFSLFLLIMMLMVSGMAIDLMRVETERARLQSTLDRAVLAGASLEQTLDSKEVVLDYFAKAGLGAYISADDVTVTPGDNSKTVTAKAFMNVSTFFMNLLGIDELSAPASGSAEESLSNIEISLVLDISGSMNWYSSNSGNRKIEDLISAAQDFVYLMQCNPDDSSGSSVCTVDPDTVSISIVPYSEQVVVGEDLLQLLNASSEHTDSSCVDFDATDFNTTAISPTTALKRSGDIDPWTNYRSSRSSSKYADDSDRTCKPYSNREIIAYENSYSDLQTQIGNLSAGGNTSIDLGMKWGAALLDPAFAPIVQTMSSGASPTITPAFDDRPYAFNARSMQKVIVLMTDGENTSQHMLKSSFRSGPSPFWWDPNTGRLSGFRSSTGRYWYPHNDSWNYQPYNSDSSQPTVQLSYQQFWHSFSVDYYEEEFWWLPDPMDVHGYSTKNARLTSICNAAKGHDIEIFTIGFETSNASSAIMQSCASSDAHHFDVDGLDISNAFTSIAREIHELRLTN